tara:strand:+ start:286 stop:450 length:165 start_codon:yes stop_codon:yes gene_type:complete
MKTYTVTFATIMKANTAEEAAKEVADGLKNNAYKNMELIVEHEGDRPEYIHVKL